MTDPIADLLTQIRNAQNALHNTVSIPYSTFKENIVRIMVREGFLSDCEVVGEGPRKQLVVTLRYLENQELLMTGLKRVSKPGSRVYRGVDALAQMQSGMGIVILSTAKGVMTSREACQQRLGGEVLCRIW